MAASNLSDVDFNSSTFKDVMSGSFYHRLGFLSSGVLTEAPDAVINPNDKGYTVSLPKYDTLTGDSDQITSSSTTTINSLGTYLDKAVWVEREKAWGADQMIKVVSGYDVTAEVARALGEYWAGELHRIFVSGTLAGVFATELSSSHSTGNTYAGATIDPVGIGAAKLKIGDNSDLLTQAIMNPKVLNDAVQLKIAQYDNGQADSLITGTFANVMGMRTTMTDKLTATSSIYPSYFAAQGAAIFKFRNREPNSFTNMNRYTFNNQGLNIEVELNRVATTAGGQDQLISRASIISHIPGVAYNTGSVASNPTIAQMATGSNWTKVVGDDKAIRIVQLKTL